MPLKVEIVTAERVVFSDEGVSEVVVPGVEGELTVLPQHAPLMTMVQPGVMQIKHGGEEIDMAITGGFLEVRDDRVTILADAAERAEDIDEVRAEEARRRAQHALEERESDITMAAAAAELQRALIRLKAADKRRRRGGSGRPPGV